MPFEFQPTFSTRSHFLTRVQGAGETGAATDIIVSTAAADSSSPTSTSSSDDSTPTSWECLDSDSNEQCCQRDSSDTHYCSGEGINILCYNSFAGESCCSDGCEQPFFHSSHPLTSHATANANVISQQPASAQTAAATVALSPPLLQVMQMPPTQSLEQQL